MYVLHRTYVDIYPIGICHHMLLLFKYWNTVPVRVCANAAIATTLLGSCGFFLIKMGRGIMIRGVCIWVKFDRGERCYGCGVYSSFMVR